MIRGVLLVKGKNVRKMLDMSVKNFEKELAQSTKMSENDTQKAKMSENLLELKC